MDRLACISSLFLLMQGCSWQQSPEVLQTDTPYNLEIPDYFPAMDIPPDNELTKDRVALGKRLFFEPLLSADSSISCGTCHIPSNAFAEPRAISAGVEGRVGLRNAPSLANVGWQQHMFWDGGKPTLEMQALAPLTTHEEMDLPIHFTIKRLQAHPEYTDMFRMAYDRDVDPFGLVRALAAFQRTLVSAGSSYDRYLSGDDNALSSQAKQGMKLFFSEELNCGTCHSGPLLTSLGFEHNGLKENYSSDPGRMRVTANPSDEGFFKVPSLRNIAATGPYMHDGSLATLDEVIDHYALGGKGHPLKSPLVAGFELADTDKAALLAFLESLTDHAFRINPAYQP